jgi:hypothetical protein
MRATGTKPDSCSILWLSFSGYLEKIPLAIASNDLADLQFCNAYNDVPLMMEIARIGSTRWG